MLRRNGKLLEEILRIMSTVKPDRSFDFNPYLFKKAFITDCSSTEENLNAVEHIEYAEGKCSEGIPVIGPKIKNKEVLLSDIFFDCIENNDDVIQAVLKKYPKMTEDEVSAALRFITIALTGMECEFLGEE